MDWRSLHQNEAGPVETIASLTYVEVDDIDSSDDDDDEPCLQENVDGILSPTPP